MIRRPLRLLLRPPLLVLALAWAPFAIAGALDLEVWWGVTVVEAFTGYAIVLTAVVAVLCWALGARIVALVALAGLLVLVVPRAGRVTANHQPPANGMRIVVATANVRLGSGDARALVRLVHDHRVDALALQEDTPAFTRRAEAAGLRTELPYGVPRPDSDAKGISLYTRWPVARVAPYGPRDGRSVGGVVTLPTSERIQIRAVHPAPPLTQSRLGRWKRWMDALPGPAGSARTGGAPTILAGDFNATLDHHPLRRILGAGYRDAADETGQAWRPTWRQSWKTLTLDHVLVPPHVAVEQVRIRDLPGSDHDVVLSTLRLRG